MTTAIQRRKGTTSNHSTFIGLEAEITIDTDKETVVVHDGTTQGGFPLLRAEGGAQNISTSGDITVNTDALFVDASAKNVGIGTSTPQGLVDSKSTAAEGINFVAEAKGSVGDTSGYYFTGHNVATPNRKAAILVKKTGDFGVGDMHFVLDSNTDDAGLSQASDTKMTILSGGNVGIGTASPTSQYGTNLNIEHATSSALHLTTVNSGTSNTDGFHITNSSGIAYLWNREDTDMAFATDNTEAMRIDSSQSLLIGPSGAAATTITAAGAATFAGLMKSGSAQVEVASTATNNLYGGNSYFGGTGDSSSNANASILNTGAATFAGSVKIGGTAAVNEIDEYEEGTWTPSQGPGITLVGTFSSGGDYIKIGNLVHLTGWVQGSTSIAVSAGGAVFIGNLPFNIKAADAEMRYDFIVGAGGGVTGGGYAWNLSFYTYSMTTSISATSQKILFQLTYSVLA